MVWSRYFKGARRGLPLLVSTRDGLLSAVLICTFSVYAGGIEPRFQRQVIDGDIQIGYGLAVGRVDADELDDVLLADKAEIVWYENPGKAGTEWAKHVIARNLTPRDNVCLAARDVDGDGLVEIAVGANWNPGETSNAEVSGNLFVLKRPVDPRGPWPVSAVSPHQPTTHRMHWVGGEQGYRLAVLPLHGVGNRDGVGKNVEISMFERDGDALKLSGRIDTAMHMTHNFELSSTDVFPGQEVMVVAGKEGLQVALASGRVIPVLGNDLSNGVGEVRRYPQSSPAVVAIEPMHGTDVVLYQQKSEPHDWSRQLVDGSLSEGHALAAADLCGDGRAEIVAGWRGRDSAGKVGIKLYTAEADGWSTHWLDDNQIACEDLKVVDLNGDGKLDVIGAGRATKNVVVYWNQSP